MICFRDKFNRRIILLYCYTIRLNNHVQPTVIIAPKTNTPIIQYFYEVIQLKLSFCTTPTKPPSAFPARSPPMSYDNSHQAKHLLFKHTRTIVKHHGKNIRRRPHYHKRPMNVRNLFSPQAFTHAKNADTPEIFG